jgi:hypothetical protein
MARPKKQKSASTSPDGFPEKSWNKLSEIWRDAAQAKQTEELEKDIIKSVRAMSGFSFDMKNDAKLTDLQEDLKALKGGYTDAIGAEKAKVDFCVYLFNTRGQPISSDTKKAVKKASDAEVDDEETSD